MAGLGCFEIGIVRLKRVNVMYNLTIAMQYSLQACQQKKPA